MTRKKHPNKDIEAALVEIEGLGWHFEDTGKSAHACHKMLCPYKEAQSQCDGNSQWCMKSVWKTPRSPENHARDLKRNVYRCIKYQ